MFRIYTPNSIRLLQNILTIFGPIKENLAKNSITKLVRRLLRTVFISLTFSIRVYPFRSLHQTSLLSTSVIRYVNPTCITITGEYYIIIILVSVSISGLCFCITLSPFIFHPFLSLSSPALHLSSSFFFQ